MATPKDHWNPDGSCDCPKDEQCFECGAPCSDHDLVADYYWCNRCTNRSWDQYEREHNEPI